jgi:hypothetical protein
VTDSHRHFGPVAAYYGVQSRGHLPPRRARRSAPNWRDFIAERGEWSWWGTKRRQHSIPSLADWGRLGDRLAEASQLTDRAVLRHDAKTWGSVAWFRDRADEYLAAAESASVALNAGTGTPEAAAQASYEANCLADLWRIHATVTAREMDLVRRGGVSAGNPACGPALSPGIDPVATLNREARRAACRWRRGRHWLAPLMPERASPSRWGDDTASSPTTSPAKPIGPPRRVTAPHEWAWSARRAA